MIFKRISVVNVISYLINFFSTFKKTFFFKFFFTRYLNATCQALPHNALPLLGNVVSQQRSYIFLAERPLHFLRLRHP